MKRRDFVIGLGAAAAGSVLSNAVHAEQTSRMYRLGVLVGGQRPSSHIAAFFDELQMLGFVDGQNLKIEGRYGLQGDLSPENSAAMRRRGLLSREIEDQFEPPRLFDSHVGRAWRPAETDARSHPLGSCDVAGLGTLVTLDPYLDFRRGAG
jgi:hypothetical protein